MRSILPSGRWCAWFFIAGLFAGLGGCASERPLFYSISHRFTVSDPQFTQTVDNLLGPQLEAGNTVTTLVNGDQIFPSMLGAIRSAQKSITLETFIYWSGSIGEEFTAALCERAKAGVHVHVLFDAVGSSKISSSYIVQMRKVGVHVRDYHPFSLLNLSSWALLDHRTHRKILVVDGVIGFTGGVGIADEWRGHAERPAHWRDNHYRIEGPVVGQLQAVFMDNWIQATGEVLDGNDYFPKLDAGGELVAQVCKSSSLGGSESMELMVLLSIASSSKSLRMESAYFVPDKLTRDALIAARKRGVVVEIIVPGLHIDEKIVRQASKARWGALLKEGVNIYEYQPTMFHCKQLIVDDIWTSIGSSNIDNRSFRLNDEANLNIFDAKFAAQQTKIFEADKLHARQYTRQAWEHRSLGERITDKISNLLGPEI